jgi:hypothetical protein
LNASGDSISTHHLSTSQLGFLNASGDSISTNHLSTSQLGFLNASGDSISTNNLSTSQLGFLNASGDSLSTHLISTSQLEFYLAYGTTLSSQAVFLSSINGVSIDMLGASTFSTLYFSTAVGLDATVSTLRVSTIMGSSDLPIFTFDMENRRVGINLGGTQQPRATVDVSGIVYANNFVTTSDRRLKSDIAVLPVPTIPQSYRYTHTETGEADIGVMADEIEAILPECVYIRPDGYKAVSYIKLVPVCFSLIQALTERLEVLERIHSNLI